MPAPETAAPPTSSPPAPLLLGIGHAVMCYLFWFVNDDAYISFRYARNFADGLGLRYNVAADPPVEGYSNFLWVLVTALVEWVNGPVPLLVPLLSCLCGFALVWLVYQRLGDPLGLPPVIRLLGALSLVLYPPFAAWSSSGLETMPFALFVFLTFDRLALHERPDWLGGSVSGLLLSLIRLEGIAWFAVIVVLSIARQVVSRQFHLVPILISVALTGVLFGAYFAWRYQYFGEPMPNTAYAKVHGAASYDRGLRYLTVNWLTFLTPLLILPGTLCALRPARRNIGLFVAAMAWAFPTYAVVVSGDFMAMGRLLIPGLPFAAILLAWLLDDLQAWQPRNSYIVPASGMVVLVLGLLPGADVNLVPSSVRAGFHFRFNTNVFVSEAGALRQQRQRPKIWLEQGRALQQYAAQEQLGPEALLCTGGMGAIGYACDLQIYDSYGLVVPEIARRDVASDEPRRSPGHDKEVDLPFLVRFAPDILWSWTFKAPDSAAAARIAVEICGELRGMPTVRAAYLPQVFEYAPDQPSRQKSYLFLLRRIDEATSRPAQPWRTFVQGVGQQPIPVLGSAPTPR